MDEEAGGSGVVGFFGRCDGAELDRELTSLELPVLVLLEGDGNFGIGRRGSVRVEFIGFRGFLVVDLLRVPIVGLVNLWLMVLGVVGNIFVTLEIRVLGTSNDGSMVVEEEQSGLTVI